MTISRYIQRNGQRGFSLTETIVYIAILAIISTAFTVTSVTLLKTFAYVRASSDLAQTATFALERMTREIRFAYNVDTGGSVLLVHPGTLALDTLDTSGSPSTALFTLSGGQLMLIEGGGTPTPLTRNGVTITNLTFTHTLGTFTEAVRIDLTLEKPVREDTISETFRTFVVLDGS